MINMKTLLSVLTITILFSCKGQVDKKNELTTDNSQFEYDSTVSIRFINGYVDLNNITHDLRDRLNWVDSNRLVTDGFKLSLKEIINNVSADNPLEADPIFNAQDYPDKGFEINDFNRKTGQVILTGNDWPDFEVALQLKLVKGITLVDGCGLINMQYDE